MSDPEATQANDAFQRDVTRLLLAELAGSGFALAGAGAVRAHGLTARPTYDVDLFTVPLISESDFRAAVTSGEGALRAAGYAVAALRVTATFARVQVKHTSGQVLDVDFAPNWRAEPPVVMDVGPVLSERDAVAGKLSAVYSRGEVRDFLDLDAIRASGRYPDAELLALGREHDDGFDPAMFAAQLARVARFRDSEATEYGIVPDEFHAVQHRIVTWAKDLHDRTEGQRATAPGQDTLPRPRQADPLGIDTPPPEPRPDSGIDL